MVHSCFYGLLAAMGMAVASPRSGHAATETVIYTFDQKVTGSFPGPLLVGKAGTLAGATGAGGGHGGVFYTVTPPKSGAWR